MKIYEDGNFKILQEHTAKRVGNKIPLNGDVKSEQQAASQGGEQAGERKFYRSVNTSDTCNPSTQDAEAGGLL